MKRANHKGLFAASLVTYCFGKLPYLINIGNWNLKKNIHISTVNIREKINVLFFNNKFLNTNMYINADKKSSKA